MNSRTQRSPNACGVLPRLSGTVRFALRLRNLACMHRPKNKRKAPTQHQRTYLPRRDTVHSRLVQAADCWRIVQLSCTIHRWSLSALLPAKVVLPIFSRLAPLSHGVRMHAGDTLGTRDRWIWLEFGEALLRTAS